MRTVDLSLDRKNAVAVQGINTPSPLAGIVLVQNDELQIVVHNLIANPAVPPTPVYQEAPLTFTSMRASLLNGLNAAPQSGSFKLTVGDHTTAALVWSNPTTADAVTAWKASVLAALQGLTGVGTGAIVAADPPSAPAHFLTFRWTDPTRTDAITVTENTLTPLIDAVVERVPSGAGYTQLLKLIQFPIIATTAFTHPSTPPAAITSSVTGASGTNAVQLLTIPAAATGALSLTWNGAATDPLDVTSLTATALTTALNGLVPNGATTPSFSVAPRAGSGSDQVFAITFLGPLAGAPQTDLGVSMSAQSAYPYASGTMDLRGVSAIDEQINGGTQGSFTFELVIDEEERYILPVIIRASGTGPETLSALEQAGGIVRVETPVYIDQTSAEPFAEIAVGFTFTPTGAGSALVIAHGLGTFRPGVRVTLIEVNHTTFAADPTNLAAAQTGSHPIRDVAYSVHCDTANQLTLTLPWALVNDPTSPLDYRLLKVDVYSPEATIKLWLAAVTSDNVTIDGTTLTAKIAALEAALGVVGGSLKVSAGNLTGTLTATQIDLTSLLTALGQGSASTSLTTLLQSILTSTSNTSLINSLASSLSNSSTFASTISQLVTAALQGGTGLPAGASPKIVPEVHWQIPLPQSIQAAPTVTSVPATVTTTEGGTTTVATQTTQVSTPVTLPYYIALPTALTGASAAPGTFTGILDPALDNTKIYTIGTAGASSRPARGHRGRTFAAGATVANQGGFFFEVIQIGSVWYPKDFEREFFGVALDDDDFAQGTQFALNAAPSFLLQSTLGLRGRIVLAIQQGVYVQAASADLSSITWSTIASQVIYLSSVTEFRRISLLAQRATDGTLTGSLTLGNRAPASFTPASANLAFRGLLTQADFENVADPRGSFKFDLVTPLASIAPLAGN